MGPQSGPGSEGSKGSEGSEGSEGKVDARCAGEGYGRLSAAGCVKGLYRMVVVSPWVHSVDRVQKVQKVQRVQRVEVAAPPQFYSRRRRLISWRRKAPAPLVFENTIRQTITAESRTSPPERSEHNLSIQPAAAAAPPPLAAGNTFFCRLMSAIRLSDIFPPTGIYQPRSHHPQVPRFFAGAQNDCVRREYCMSDIYHLSSIFYLLTFNFYLLSSIFCH